MTKYKELIPHTPTQEEIDKWIEERKQIADYEIGDWVETCDMLPGIVQGINYRDDLVEIFYPHYAFREDCIGHYTGKSHCSIEHCGVHKITPEYAIKLMSLGREILSNKWRELTDNITGPADFDWEEEVNKLYNKHFKDK